MSTSGFNVEQMLQYADDLRNRAHQLEEEVRHTEIDVTSRDKAITVTVTIPGKIKDLRLDRSAVEGRDPDELANDILGTIRSAQEVGEQAGKDLTNRYLPNLPNFSEMLERKESDAP